MSVGHAYLVMEQYEEAIRFLSECVRRSPDNPTAQRSLAICYVETGEMEKARHHVRELMRAMPEFKVEEYATFTDDDALRDRMRANLRKAGAK